MEAVPGDGRCVDCSPFADIVDGLKEKLADAMQADKSAFAVQLKNQATMIDRLLADRGRLKAENIKLREDVQLARDEVVFFAERLEKQDHQYSHGHPQAAIFRVKREALESERDAARADLARVTKERDEARSMLAHLRNVVHDHNATNACSADAGCWCDDCKAERKQRLEDGALSPFDLPAVAAATRFKDRMSEGLQRQLVSYLLVGHPMPWRIDCDWTVEVLDADGTNVVKLQCVDAAEELIRAALALDGELSAAPPPGDAKVKP